MWLNQQTIDGIRIMAALASLYPKQGKAADLSDKIGISVLNVQKTVHALSLAGLVKTQRGRQGGIKLAKLPGVITVGEIVRVFEPTDCPVNYLAAAAVDKAVSELLFNAHREFFRVLETANLESVTAKTLDIVSSNQRLRV